MTKNEAPHAQYLPLLWLVRQSVAAVGPNDVILTNLITSHCINPISSLSHSFDRETEYSIDKPFVD